MRRGAARRRRGGSRCRGRSRAAPEGRSRPRDPRSRSCGHAAPSPPSIQTLPRYSTARIRSRRRASYSTLPALEESGEGVPFAASPRTERPRPFGGDRNDRGKEGGRARRPAGRPPLEHCSTRSHARGICCINCNRLSLAERASGSRSQAGSCSVGAAAPRPGRYTRLRPRDAPRSRRSGEPVPRRRKRLQLRSGGVARPPTPAASDPSLFTLRSATRPGGRDARSISASATRGWLADLANPPALPVVIWSHGGASGSNAGRRKLAVGRGGGRRGLRRDQRRPHAAERRGARRSLHPSRNRHRRRECEPTARPNDSECDQFKFLTTTALGTWPR